MWRCVALTPRAYRGTYQDGALPVTLTYRDTRGARRPRSAWSLRAAPDCGAGRKMHSSDKGSRHERSRAVTDGRWGTIPGYGVGIEFEVAGVSLHNPNHSNPCLMTKRIAKKIWSKWVEENWASDTEYQDRTPYWDAPVRVKRARRVYLTRTFRFASRRPGTTFLWFGP
jgi:hypothetical protein